MATSLHSHSHSHSHNLEFGYSIRRYEFSSGKEGIKLNAKRYCNSRLVPIDRKSSFLILFENKLQPEHD